MADKSVCGSCKKSIDGKAVTAIDGTWHPEHFVCTHCKEEIGAGKFFVRERQPYCEKDHVSLFADKCHHCNEPIVDEGVRAMDKMWHKKHFVCAKCGAVLNGYTLDNGKPFCSKECKKMFEPKCGRCQGAILEKHIPALDKLWHPECFVCADCSKPLEIGKHFGQFDLYCESHQKPFVCTYGYRSDEFYCGGPIFMLSGLFICTSCHKELYESDAKKQEEKPYCQGCFDTLACSQQKVF